MRLQRPAHNIEEIRVAKLHGRDIADNNNVCVEPGTLLKIAVDRMLTRNGFVVDVLFLLRQMPSSGAAP